MDDVLKKLPRVKSRWPKEALLTGDAKFTMMDGDRVVGVISLNAGAQVKILDIKPEHALIQFNSAKTALPVSALDIIDQLGGAEKILSLPDDPEVEAAPASPSQPPNKEPKGKTSGKV